MIRSFLLILSLAATCCAFAPPQTSKLSSSALFMAAPRFDKTAQRWYPASPEEGSESAYDLTGSLLRQGPNAFFKRLLNPDEYDQACLKFMAQEGCTYQQAQGNM